MEELPRVGAMGAQPYSDILGMGDPGDRTMPAIVCLACSSRWPNADAFWAASRLEDGPEGAMGAADGEAIVAAATPDAPGDREPAPP